MKKLLTILCLVLALCTAFSMALAEDTTEVKTPEYTRPEVIVEPTATKTGWLYLYNEEDETDFHEVVLYWGGNDYTVLTKDQAKAAYDSGKYEDKGVAVKQEGNCKDKKELILEVSAVFDNEAETAYKKADGNWYWYSKAAADAIKPVEYKYGAEHKWGPEYQEIVKPDCTHKGKLAILCTICGTVKEGSEFETDNSKFIHAYADGSSAVLNTKDNPPVGFTLPGYKAATCQEDGVNVNYCALCLKVLEGKVKVGNGKEVTEQEFKNEEVKASPDFHLFGDDIARVITTEPTCTETGLAKGYKICSICKTRVEVENIEVPALGHKYAWKVTTEGTCSVEPEVKYVCANKGCPEAELTIDEVEDEAIKAEGEALLEKEQAKAEFNHKDADGNNTLKLLEDETVEPTCHSEGSKTYQCSQCQRYHYETIAKTEHKWSKTVKTSKGSCKGDGTPAGTYVECENEGCDEIKWITNDGIPAHQWTEWKMQNPYSEKDGVVTVGYWTRTCKVCDNVDEYYQETADTPAPTDETDPDDPTPVDPDDPVDPEPEKDPEYKAVDGKFDADEMMVSGKVEHVEGTGEAEKLYARITFFMADGTFTVTTAPVVDGAYEAMNSGDIIHIAVQVTNTNKVKPGEFNSYGSQEFDVE